MTLSNLEDTSSFLFNKTGDIYGVCVVRFKIWAAPSLSFKVFIFPLEFNLVLTNHYLGETSSLLSKLMLFSNFIPGFHIISVIFPDIFELEISLQIFCLTRMDYYSTLLS